MTVKRLRALSALALGLSLAGASWAALPPPSAAQAQAAAAKKAEADAKAAKEKEALNASMDRISGQWRQRAAQEGWTIKPPPPVTGPMGVAASDPTPASAGVPAPAPAGGAPGTSGAAPATAAAPLGARALHAATVPVKSEKLGTARPSEDVKQGPTRAEPAGASPTVNKQGVPRNAPKQ
ncbi:hypothetical protein SOM61_02140 [Massilia sp. CFBP9012]|uniref:hypothetical protein n=1 Tax=Massilia sp. CFBP9012 TaxID=3096531 RepID=UPI002A6A92FB|nr:hypothetical protein [Massilia sp. CFBP9012]MDY0973748.1 hypothetical protein [Massilia sp. CFBP9012]